ncbi:MAG: AMP-binding protein, partial [Thermocrispum sp.]
MTPTTLSVPEDGVASSLAGMLHARARQSPDTVVLTALDADGAAVARLTASEADIEARTLAAELRATAEPGDRILLPSMPGLKFHTAFLACLYAGLVAVPAPPVRAARRGDGQQPVGVRRLAAICHDVRPAAVVVPANRLFKIAAAWAEEKTLAALPLVCCEPADALREPLPAPEPVAPDALAFLQYTSGSTSEPRGVMITHGAMLANQAALRERLSITTRTTLVSWLPTFHDLGLALGVLQPMYTGSSAVVMEPETFLRRPERWLQALSKRSDAVSAAPDFAYAWCAARVSPQAKAELDLSGWRVAVNGAEPLRADTVRDFHSAFAGCGLREHAQTSAYG